MNLILGVTGGSGCGKSAFCRELSALGAYVIDADIVAREVVEPGRPALREITEAFGTQYLQKDGQLDRKALGAAVFSDSEKLHRLNGITHKYITEEIKERLARKTSGLRIIDAPLLFESGLNQLCGRTACVLATREIRAERIMRRDNLNETAALARINAQQPDEFYVRQTDDVIRNDQTEEMLCEVAKKYWIRLEKET